MPDHDEFLVLLLEHDADLKAFIGSLVQDRHARDDVFQECVLTLWKKFAAYDRSRSFGAWARGFAANMVMKHKQADHRFPCVFVPETIQSILDAYERTEAPADLRASYLAECVDGLPEDQRTLLAERYERGARPKSIAAARGRSVDAIYQALSRIRMRLEACVRKKLNASQSKPVRTRILAD